jgi:hypothetical protein
VNRHERRAAAKKRPANDDGRAEAIRLAYKYLANGAASTATGATIVHPDGTMTYLSADDARSLYGHPGGVEQ